ncbi:Ubiquitin-ribosomal 60S subunit protein L40B fusion protein [Oopsacas minuta]|uniref:Ubiquitin-ribosomal 60S subunit protein L40B fusion protein n=1 Tax=Oopsacas minuta TaxID=111878 RepID=A0AAV7K9X1_9METZ|nr:Ubiquitin-ribosomal 60S subunit protein L40B fusion protein [Oopsacas minuta]
MNTYKGNHGQEKASGYDFKGVVDVPKLVEQSYYEQQVDEPESGYFKTFFKVAAGVVIGGVGTAVVIIAVSVSVPLLIGATVVGVGAAAGGAVGGIVGAKIYDKSKCHSVQILISTFDGRDISLVMQSNNDTIQQLKVRIQQKLGIKPESQCLSYQGIPLEDTNTLESYNITNNSTITLSIRIQGGSSRDLYFIDHTYMDPSWDYDFTNISDGDTKFMRGGYPYYRPCGWKRIAIKVLGKYSDEKWLDTLVTKVNGQ